MIETKRLILRPVVYEDAQAIYDYSSDRDVVRYVTYDQYQSMDDAYDSLRSFFLNRDPDKQFEAMAIVLKKNNKMIGTCDTSSIFREDMVELGYVLHKDYWNQGIMSEAAYAMCQWLFKEKDIRRIEVTHDPRNIASKRVIEKVGFKFEGLRRAYTAIDNKYQDMPYYSLLEEDINERIK